MRPTKHPWAANAARIAAVAALFALGACAAPTIVAEPSGTATIPEATDSPSMTVRPSLIVEDGHVDIAPRLVDDTLRLELHTDGDGPETWHDPAEVAIGVGPAARRQLPDDGSVALLGAPGATVWLLSQVQEPGLPWPGWSTQDPSLVARVPGGVEWSLESHEGPGALVLFVIRSFGVPDVLFDSRDPVPQSIVLSPDTHAHGNWAFTAAGVHRAEFSMRAVDTDGRTLAATATVTFVVDQDEAQALPATEASGTTTPDLPLAVAGALALFSSGVAAVLALAALMAMAMDVARRRRGADAADTQPPDAWDEQVWPDGHWLVR